MKATLLFHERRLYDDGAILEMRIWRVAEAVPPSTQGLKYGLFYGYPGRRVVGYDNERGKGDHRHYEGQELDYRFISVERLVADFLSDVGRVRGSV